MKPYAIFDMDGTLIDSMAYWRGLAEEYLGSKGVKKVPPEILERIKPMTMLQSAALFNDEFSLGGTPRGIADEMNAMIEDHYRNDIPLKPGVKAYLERLKSGGTVMCVVSATAPELMRSCLERLGVADMFAFLLSCEEVGPGKDEPDSYLEAARRLGAAPREIAVFEDASYALKTASAAGFYTVAVYDDSTAAKWPSIRSLADEAIESFLAAE